MKVIIDGKVYDSQHTPIVISWDTDDERLTTGKQIYNMEDKDTQRFYANYPAGTNGHEVMDQAKEAYGQAMREPISMMW